MANRLVCDVCDHAIENPSFTVTVMVRRDVKGRAVAGTYLENQTQIDLCMACSATLPAGLKQCLHALLVDPPNSLQPTDC